MKTVGYILFFFTLIAGFAFAQYVFLQKTGRFFWRGLLPYELRRKFFPNDHTRLDSFHFLEEWFAILYLGAFLTLPLIALDFIGFLKIFD